VSVCDFRGTEKFFRKQFGSALLSAQVGYIGGDDSKFASASYEQVCTGKTGHAEALHITFDPTAVKYEALVEFFFRMHDPTTKDRQGNDRGTQYRSAIFTYSDEQAKIAKEVMARIQESHLKGKAIMTAVVPATKFWKAEDYHQRYLENNPGGYCNHRLHW
jgi:peptide-methionine (S)-S-oxide reductase